MSGEIKVQYKNLDDGIRDLERLASTIEARKLNIRFDNSKGKLADEMLHMAEMLQEYGLAYAQLIRRCGEGVYNGRVLFEENDQRAGRQFTSRNSR